jgi:acyl carrier protein
MDLEELRELLTTTTGRPYEPLKPEQELTDLGLESIDRVRIIARIEQRLHRDIDERVAMQLRTVGDLLALATSGVTPSR